MDILNIAFRWLLPVALLAPAVSCGQGNHRATAKQAIEMNNNETIVKSEAEWRQQLSPEQYYILRQKGTERPFSGKLLMHKE